MKVRRDLFLPAALALATFLTLSPTASGATADKSAARPQAVKKGSHTATQRAQSAPRKAAPQKKSPSTGSKVQPKSFALKGQLKWQRRPADRFRQSAAPKARQVQYTTRVAQDPRDAEPDPFDEPSDVGVPADEELPLPDNEPSADSAADDPFEIAQPEPGDDTLFPGDASEPNELDLLGDPVEPDDPGMDPADPDLDSLGPLDDYPVPGPDDPMLDSEPLDRSSDSTDAERKRQLADCERAWESLRSKRLGSINLSTRMSGKQGEDYPYECTLAEESFMPRSWADITYTWKPSALCHKALYFEDEHLERYGHSWGPFVQPFVSGAHFFAEVPLLPYKMGLKPPHECVYALGYYRPGSCAPYLIDPLPLSTRAALFQAGAVVGAAAIVP